MGYCCPAIEVSRGAQKLKILTKAIIKKQYSHKSTKPQSVFHCGFTAIRSFKLRINMFSRDSVPKNIVI